MRTSFWLTSLVTVCAACSGHTDDTLDGAGGSQSTGGTGAGNDASAESGGSATGSGGAGASGGGAGAGGATGGVGGAGAGGATGGVGGAAGNGGFAGDIIIDDFWPPPLADIITCVASCRPIGGQFCGRISDNCGKYLECGTACDVPGFTCGGAGIPNLCGAPRDSGGCKPTACDQRPAGQYCGIVGDGCGGIIDCGGCAAPFTCGAGGVPNLCGALLDSGVCTPSTCSEANVRRCGVIGDGCGNALDCGSCEGGDTCGQSIAGICGSPDTRPPPPPSLPPPPPPPPPVPPFPPPPMVGGLAQ
jgi:hypothetical protein